ncbi:MAG: triosephosphate isomerase [Candidatus Omnitrophota bacterium]|jgi:triosephosphate isomerase
MRTPIIAGNWKLNKTVVETIQLINDIKRELANVSNVDVVICPTFLGLTDAVEAVNDLSIEIGAQNLYWENSGAFTGEISGEMIKATGAKYVIVGHSERRQFFGETNETVNKRVRAALDNGLLPIVCVGENLEEREGDKTFDVIKNHITGSLAGFTAEEVQGMVLAYEPVWAIGTGKTASPEQAQEVHKYIRDLLTELYDEATASVVRLQYGGSVKPDNIDELIAQPDIDGALVGGASLKSDSFAGIVKGAAKVGV